jgi:hypothetical protein
VEPVWNEEFVVYVSAALARSGLASSSRARLRSDLPRGLESELIVEVYHKDDHGGVLVSAGRRLPLSFQLADRRRPRGRSAR